MIVLIDGDSLPYVTCYNRTKEELTELEDFKRKTDNYILAILQCVASNSYIMYLSGKDNFRYKIEAQKPYKGNRGGGEKPMFFDEIRQYLIDQYRAVVTDGCENDDLLVMSQTYLNSLISSEDLDYGCCIASMDKDLLQCPGYHVNIKKLNVIELTKDEAWRNLWIQVLTGDSTDNIAGCEGIGPSKANNCLDSTIDPAQYPQMVLDKYIEVYGEELGEKWFRANYQLVRLITNNRNFRLPEVQNIDKIIAEIVK